MVILARVGTSAYCTAAIFVMALIAAIVCPAENPSAAVKEIVTVCAHAGSSTTQTANVIAPSNVEMGCLLFIWMIPYTAIRWSTGRPCGGPIVQHWLPDPTVNFLIRDAAITAPKFMVVPRQAVLVNPRRNAGN